MWTLCVALGGLLLAPESLPPDIAGDVDRLRVCLETREAQGLYLTGCLTVEDAINVPLESSMHPDEPATLGDDGGPRELLDGIWRLRHTRLRFTVAPGRYATELREHDASADVGGAWGPAARAWSAGGEQHCTVTVEERGGANHKRIRGRGRVSDRAAWYELSELTQALWMPPIKPPRFRYSEYLLSDKAHVERLTSPEGFECVAVSGAVSRGRGWCRRWFSLEHGGLAVRDEYRSLVPSPHGRRETAALGPVDDELVVRAVKEMVRLETGLWLPTETVRRHFRLSPEEGWMPWRITVYSLGELAVCQPAPAVFAPLFPNASVVFGPGDEVVHSELDTSAMEHAIEQGDLSFLHAELPDLGLIDARLEEARSEAQ